MNIEISWAQTSVNIMRFNVIGANSPDNMTEIYCNARCSVSIYIIDNWNHVERQISRDYLNGVGTGTSTPMKLMNEWSKFLPRTGVIDVYSTFAWGPCFRIFNGNNMAADLGCAATGGGISPPTPPISCSINGDVYFHYGVLSNDNLNGLTKKETAFLSCTESASVKVKAQTNGGSDIVALSSDGSLKASLKVNDIIGTSGDVVTVSGKESVPVIFSSTLITSGEVHPGEFSGSGVVILTII